MKLNFGFFNDQSLLACPLDKRSLMIYNFVPAPVMFPSYAPKHSNFKFLAYCSTRMEKLTDPPQQQRFTPQVPQGSTLEEQCSAETA